MNSLYNVIIRPIISERSYDLMEQGKYTFEVAKDAPKQEIRQAVEKLFNVHVVKVNTMNVRGKEKRVRAPSRGPGSYAAHDGYARYRGNPASVANP